MDVRALHDGWTLRPAAGEVPEEVDRAGWIPAQVPGTVHTDLLTAGLVPDPYVGENEAALRWLHRSAWEYRTRLDTGPPGPGERVELQFDGLDTVATVTLGGTELGRTVNMHRGHRFDLTGPLARLPEGPADLVVRFDSALEHAESVEKDIGARPRTYEHPYNAVRKMACSFGWDWGPDLQTAGIWRRVTLQRWRTARLATVRPVASLHGSTGRLRVHVDVERSGLEAATALTVHVDLGGHGTAAAVLEPATARAVLEVEVPDAPVWWPRGYGEQPLVEVAVRLCAPGGGLLDERSFRTGFRDVRIDDSPDEFGTRTVVVVNGQPVFVRGVNWIPRDHLLTRLDADRYAAALDDAVDAHCNLVRVWGGGLWESEDFYRLCDERGLLVWQDFPLACAAYAEEDPLRTEFEAEVRENVTRLVHHPSLAVWSGGNENLQGHEDWGWKEELGSSTWGAGYYHDLFPALLAELDGTRPYQPGSPMSPAGAPEGTHPNDPDHGTNHEWDVWNRLGWPHYRDRVPRFCAEFGYQAPPTLATIAEFLPADQRSATSPAFLAHQKALDGNGKLERGMEPHTGVPSGFEDWVWAAQLNQARAVACAVEHHRSWWPRTAGSIYWQLDDCWPVTSWAVVDGSGRRKPAFHALRRAFAPRVLTVQPREGVPHVVVVNDTAQEFSTRVLVRRTTPAGAVLDRTAFEVSVPARAVRSWPLPLVGGDGEPVVVDAGGLRAVHLDAPDKDLPWDPDPLRVSVTRLPDGYAVRVRAESFARDVTLLADAVTPDARVGEGLVTLLPGESHTFLVRTGAVVDAGAFTGALRTANEFGRP
ncbi:glycoside hydrolase family 2 protein [Kineococcus sp. SYSU DK001]|uniref:glycoside hydrolase family 2 protein n=1 Tax=Kineococcus sp. SYSU DK001 TaxID=3383122 RepID=UPI003D7E1F3E